MKFVHLCLHRKMCSVLQLLHIYMYLYICVCVCFSEVPCHSPTLKVLASSDETNEASFSCFAYDFSPKDYEIKWLKGEEDIPGTVNKITTPIWERKLDNGTKLYNVASFLTLQDVPVNTQFTCEFKGKCEGEDVFTNSSVIYNPRTPGE